MTRSPLIAALLCLPVLGAVAAAEKLENVQALYTKYGRLLEENNASIAKLQGLTPRPADFDEKMRQFNKLTIQYKDIRESQVRLIKKMGGTIDGGTKDRGRITSVTNQGKTTGSVSNNNNPDGNVQADPGGPDTGPNNQTGDTGTGSNPNSSTGDLGTGSDPASSTGDPGTGADSNSPTGDPGYTGGSTDGSNPGGGPSGGPVPESLTRPSAFSEGGGSDRASGAANRAMGIGQDMIQGLRQNESMPGGGGSPGGLMGNRGGSARTPGGGSPGGGAGGATAAGGGFAADGAPNAANPSNARDLGVAAVSGFGGAFSDMGLKMGQGPGGQPAVLRRDGSPASAQEVAALQERIQSEPEALMRRPDFFNVLPRESFQQLKQDYNGRSDLRTTEFKDVGLTPRDRDFQYEATCDKVSGQCNKNARKLSYKKGSDVPPEDLKSIWARIREEAREAVAKDSGAGKARTAGRAKGMLGSGLSRLGEKLSNLGGMMGWNQRARDGGGSSSEGDPDLASAASFRRSGRDAYGRPGTGGGVYRPAPVKGTLDMPGTPPVPEAPAPDPARGSARGGIVLLGIFAVLALGALAFAWWAGRRRDEET